MRNIFYISYIKPCFISHFIRVFLVAHQALSLQPDDKNCLVARSRCYLKHGDAESALKDAETSLKDNKDFFKVVHLCCVILFYLLVWSRRFRFSFESACSHVLKGANLHNLKPYQMILAKVGHYVAPESMCTLKLWSISLHSIKKY